MKQIFIHSAFVCAAALLAVSCEQTAVAPAAVSKTVKFTASAADTRTQFGDKADGAYPTLWTADTKIHISPNGEETPSEAAATPSADGRSATFSTDMFITPGVRYYCISPSKCFDGFYPHYGNEYDFTIPDTQTSSAASCDPAAQILFAVSDEVKADTEEVLLHFTHLTAYGKLSLLNIGENAGAVQSVTLASTQTLAGIIEFYWTETPVRTTFYEPKRSLTVNTSSAGDIWFGCHPADLSGTTLDVTVKCENGKFTKKIDLTGKSLAFKAGEVSEFAIDLADAVYEENVKADGSVFVIDGEVYPCVSAVIEPYFGSVDIYIGDVEGAQSGNAYRTKMCLSISPDHINGGEFNINMSQVEIWAGGADLYFYTCTGTATVELNDGTLKLTLAGEDKWSESSAHTFSASYEGPVYDAR